MKKCLTGGRLITPREVLKGYDLIIEGQKIKEIIPEGQISHELPDMETVDVEGAYIMPGIIDIHSDMIENLIQPRTTALMDFSMGLKEAERSLAMCGITTMYHSISMFREGSWDVKEIRRADSVKKLADLIHNLKNGHRLIRHRFHLRYEIDNVSCYDEVVNMIETGRADLLSFMDHTPGQGQYKNLEVYRRHQPGGGVDLTNKDIENLVKQELSKPIVTFEQLKHLADTAKANGICVSSHDDDTIEKLSLNRRLGVRISEFPITLPVAEEAVKAGFYTVVGAPNILLGGSHSGNLSAWDAIKAGAGSILVSDYYPQSLIQAVFVLHDGYGMELPDAARLVTLNPARALRKDKTTGSLENGKNADLLVVRKIEEYPQIEQVYVDGARILTCSYRD